MPLFLEEAQGGRGHGMARVCLHGRPPKRSRYQAAVICSQYARASAPPTKERKAAWNFVHHLVRAGITRFWGSCWS